MTKSMIVLLVAFFSLPGVLVFSQSRGKSMNNDHYIKVEVKGVLRHGIMAIGGETTGTTITAGNVTWELDLGKGKDFHVLAERLKGKTVIVSGSLEVRLGVEIPKRWIVKVSGLKEAG